MKRLFPAPEFYLSVEAARAAVRSKAQFNVIHPESGMKVDFFVAGDTVKESQIRRRQDHELEGLLDRVLEATEDD